MERGAYEIKESERAKFIRITIHLDGRVVVTKPARVSLTAVRAFVACRQEWIDVTLSRIKRRHLKHGELVTLPRPRRNSRAYKEAVNATRSLVIERLAYFNRLYDFTYGAISIRNQKTRWGSCSAKNNLSFNYKIAFLPNELVDYVIVHELAHTKHHNHSQKFWSEVARAVPDWKERRKRLHVRYSL